MGQTSIHSRVDSGESQISSVTDESHRLVTLHAFRRLLGRDRKEHDPECPWGGRDRAPVRVDLTWSSSALTYAVASAGLGCPRASFSWFSCSVDSDVFSTVPPYCAISGSTLSAVDDSTSRKRAAVPGLICSPTSFMNLSSIPRSVILP